MSNTPEAGNKHPQVVIKYIGERMAEEAFANAAKVINVERGKGTDKPYLRILPAKEDHSYTGRLIFANDKHVIQQISKERAIMHDKAMLTGDLTMRREKTIEYNSEKGVASPTVRLTLKELEAKVREFAELLPAKAQKDFTEKGMAMITDIRTKEEGKAAPQPQASKEVAQER